MADDDAEGHADRFWAGMLGLAAAEGPVMEYAYETPGTQAPGHPDDDDDDDGFAAGAW